MSYCKQRSCGGEAVLNGLCEKCSKKPDDQPIKSISAGVDLRRCRVAECGRKHHAKGLCALHYKRVKTGATIERSPSKRSLSKNENKFRAPCHSNFYDTRDMRDRREAEVLIRIQHGMLISRSSEEINTR